MNLSQDRINEICELCFGTVLANSREQEVRKYNRDFIDHNKSYIENAYRKVIASGEQSKGALSDMYSAVLQQAKADKYYGILTRGSSKGSNKWGGSKSLLYVVDELDSRIIEDAKQGISMEDSLWEATSRGHIGHYLEGCDIVEDEKLLEEPESIEQRLGGKPLSFLEKVLGALGFLSETLSKWLEKLCGKDKKSDIDR
ncbi:MAG: hypothetical protein IKJ32_05210 [Clostridia bacterium]|nr:hypothetical protein [Clostridia bacterium]